MNIPFLSLKSITDSFEPQLSETVAQVIRSGWYLNGKHNRLFESAFANYTGTAYCVGVGNGLDALTIILTAMKQIYGWKDDNEVIVPALTFIATAEAISRAGLVPLFCDVTDDFLIDVKKIPSRISSKTCAILPVHLYGKVCQMEEILELSQTHHLKVVEDASQAHGATLRGRKAGSWGDAAGFSFYPGKNLGALGDGGAITTNNEELANYVKKIANYGAQKKYHHEIQGCNSRLDEIQAAVLHLKLKRLDEDNQRRQQVASIYSQGIKNEHVVLPYGGQTDSSVFHIYPIRTKHREALQNYLKAHCIETLIHYPIAVHQQEAYASYNKEFYPYAEAAAHDELSLPMSPLLTPEETKYIVEIINQFKL